MSTAKGFKAVSSSSKSSHLWTFLKMGFIDVLHYRCYGFYTSRNITTRNTTDEKSLPTKPICFSLVSKPIALQDYIFFFSHFRKMQITRDRLSSPFISALYKWVCTFVGFFYAQMHNNFLSGAIKVNLEPGSLRHPINSNLHKYWIKPRFYIITFCPAHYK